MLQCGAIFRSRKSLFAMFFILFWNASMWRDLSIAEIPRMRCLLRRNDGASMWRDLSIAEIRVGGRPSLSISDAASMWRDLSIAEIILDLRPGADAERLQCGAIFRSRKWRCSIRRAAIGSCFNVARSFDRGNYVWAVGSAAIGALQCGAIFRSRKCEGWDQ